MTRLKTYPFLIAATLLLPGIALAATVESIIGKLKGWIILLIPIVIGIGLLYFLWGIAMFIANSGDEKGRQEGKSKMIWGVLAMFVMVSIWGLVGLLSSSLDVSQGGTFTPPTF
jgi:hypothetical protein